MPLAKDLVVVEGDALVELLATTEAATSARSASKSSPEGGSRSSNRSIQRKSMMKYFSRSRSLGHALKTEDRTVRAPGGVAVQRSGVDPLPAGEATDAEIGTDIRDSKRIAAK
jgi:hypothetical protein